MALHTPKYTAPRRRKKRILPVLLFVLGFALAAFASFQLWQGHRDDAAAQGEYTELRNMLHAISLPADQAHPAPDDPDAPDIPPAEERPNPMQGFIDLNPDFAGWISVGGTPIDYPVVRGADNEAYLQTTFNGERNPAGAIFMDYRAVSGFSTPLVILYGHNMRDGSMFASLYRFLDPDFLRQYPHIAIITETGERLVYRIFDVQRTNAWDSVYTLDFHDPHKVAAFFSAAPDGTSRFLLLSTCYGSDRNARLLVYAALLENGGVL